MTEAGGPEAASGVTDGDRVIAVDPRTGIDVLGTVETTPDGTAIVPIGTGYPPGTLETNEDTTITEVVGEADEPPDPYESRRRQEWDIVCMCLSGALRNLEDHTVQVINTAMAEGHL